MTRSIVGQLCSAFWLGVVSTGPLLSQPRDSSGSQPDGPPMLYSSSLAYDEARQRLVLFGGYFAGRDWGDTWEWDGTRWTRVSQSGPAGRNYPRMVFDAGRGKVVMFGGNTRAGALGDTWEWDGRTWSEVPGPGPTARSLHGMAYDAHRQRIVVFGGRAGTGADAQFLTDTWELDRQGWKKVADTGPPPRMMPAMAYHTSLRKVILAGGNRAAGRPTDADVLGDVWAWDGAKWEAMAATPGPRDHASAASDPVNGGVLIVGGAIPSRGPMAEAWTLGTAHWSPVSVTEIGARAGHNLASDSRNKRVFMHGGFAGGGAARELWEYSAGGWKRVW